MVGDRTTYHVWGWNHPKLGSLAPTCLMLHCDSLPPDKLQLQSTYSSWKVDGAVTLYWFVSRSPVLTYLFGIGICAMYFDRGVKFSEPASQLHLIFHDWFVWPAFLGLGTCCAINITNPKSPSPSYGLTPTPTQQKRFVTSTIFVRPKKARKTGSCGAMTIKISPGNWDRIPPKKSGTGFHSHKFPIHNSHKNLFWVWESHSRISWGFWWHGIGFSIAVWEAWGVAPGRSTKRRQVYDKSTLSGSHRSEQKNMKVVVAEAQKRKQQGFL